MDAAQAVTTAAGHAAAATHHVSSQEQLFNMVYLHSTLFWTGLAFVLMLVVVWRYVTPVALGTLDGRIARIREDLDRAALLRNEAQQALAKYENQLRAARQEAHDMIARAKGEAEKIAASRIADLERELARRSEEARISIEQAKASALRDVREEIVSLAMVAAEKIIGTQVDAKAATRLTDEAIKSLHQ